MNNSHRVPQGRFTFDNDCSGKCYSQVIDEETEVKRDLNNMPENSKITFPDTL